MIEFKNFTPEELIVNSYPLPKQGQMIAGVSKGIEIIHKPTGEKVCCDKFRSQLMNKNWCLMKLEEKLTPKVFHECPNCNYSMPDLYGMLVYYCHGCSKKFEVDND